jgi:hypothetical protein
MNLVYALSIWPMWTSQRSAYIGSTDAAILNFNIDVILPRLLWLEVDDLKLVPVLRIVDAARESEDGRPVDDRETHAYPFHTRSWWDMLG